MTSEGSGQGIFLLMSGNPESKCSVLSSNVAEEKPMEVEEEEEDDQKNPGNLLDNLFRKTKTTPCLYWLPLSDEQVCKPLSFSLRLTPLPLRLSSFAHVIQNKVRDKPNLQTGS